VITDGIYNEIKVGETEEMCWYFVMGVLVVFRFSIRHPT